MDGRKKTLTKTNAVVSEEKTREECSVLLPKDAMMMHMQPGAHVYVDTRVTTHKQCELTLHCSYTLRQVHTELTHSTLAHHTARND